MARGENREHGASEFDWDEGNLLKSWVKHRVTSVEAEEVFDNDPLISDEARSRGEERYLALGVTNDGRLLTIVYTMRRDRIRVISARPMSRPERRRFEER